MAPGAAFIAAQVPTTLPPLGRINSAPRPVGGRWARVSNWSQLALTKNAFFLLKKAVESESCKIIITLPLSLLGHQPIQNAVRVLVLCLDIVLSDKLVLNIVSSKLTRIKRDQKG